MRPADGPRQHTHIVEFEILAGMTETFTGPGAFENLDGFKRASEPLAARNAEAIELLGAIAESDAEAQTAVGNYVNCRAVFGQPQWMVKRREQHVAAERNAMGARGDRRQRRHQGAKIAVIGEMMFGQPD